jgi:hypothetical protein
MFRYSQIIDVEGYAHARSETVRTVAKVVAKKKELGLKLDVDETSEWFPWETLPPEAVPLHVGQFALGTFTRERGIFTQCLDLQIMPSLEGDVSSNEVEKFLVPDDSPVDTEWKERDEPGQSLHP